MARRCCCLDVRSGAFVAATFTMTISTIQILIVLAFYGASGYSFVFAGIAEGEPTYISLSMYLLLALLDLIIIIVSALAMYGNENDKRLWLNVWIIFLAIYMLFEAGANITYFSMNIKYIASIYGDVTVIPLMTYWIVKMLVYLVCVYSVLNRLAQIKATKSSVKGNQQLSQTNLYQSAPITSAASGIPNTGMTSQAIPTVLTTGGVPMTTGMMQHGGYYQLARQQGVYYQPASY